MAINNSSGCLTKIVLCGSIFLAGIICGEKLGIRKSVVDYFDNRAVPYITDNVIPGVEKVIHEIKENPKEQTSDAKKKTESSLNSPSFPSRVGTYLTDMFKTNPNYQRPVDTSEDPLWKRDFQEYRSQHRSPLRP